MKFVVDYEVFTEADNPADDRFDYRSQRDVTTEAIHPRRLDEVDTHRIAAALITRQIVLKPGQYVHVTEVRPA